MTADNIKIARELLHYHFEQSAELEDIMESLQDKGLLNHT